MNKNNLIGISAMYPEDANALALCIQRHLQPADWEIRTYSSAVEDLAMKTLNASSSQIQSPAYLDSYLGDAWSYIREERFVNGQSEVSRKPVRYYMTPRQIVQRLRGLGREIHSNFWVNTLFSQYVPEAGMRRDPKLLQDVDVPQSQWIITDVNYPNEADAVLDRDGLLIRLDRRLEKPMDYAEKRKAKEQNLGIILRSHPHFDEKYLMEQGLDNIVTALVNKFPWLTKNTK